MLGIGHVKNMPHKCQRYTLGRWLVQELFQETKLVKIRKLIFKKLYCQRACFSQTLPTCASLSCILMYIIILLKLSDINTHKPYL